MTYKSLSTIEQANKEKFDEALRKLYPELYLIKMSLDETGINPMIIPKIIRSLGNLHLGSGYGKIQIFMQQMIITQIKGEESVNVNQPAVIDD